MVANLYIYSGLGNIIGILDSLSNDLTINSEDIASKIAALIETDQLKHHINQIKKALPKYRWDNFSENLMKFIETL